MSQTVVLGLPLAGRCLVQNSPARRVPSHGTDVMATTYAIDLVPVDAQGRSAAKRDWRTMLSTESPERFLGFGAPVLAPLGGTVVNVHDGEPDHDARRSQLSLVPYMLGQAERLRRGASGLAGNHVVLELAQGRGYVVLAHLQRGSICVARGTSFVPGSSSARAATQATPRSRTSTCRSWTEPIRWQHSASRLLSRDSASITMAPTTWLRSACQQRAPSSSQRTK